MKQLFFALIASFAIVRSLAAQEEHDHHHARNETGISTGALYSPDHNEWGAAVHIHYFRTLSAHSRWSLGGGIEQAWLDGTHWVIAAGVKYQLFDRFSLGALPGIMAINHSEGGHETGAKTLFAFHAEAVYDLFHWDKFHLGLAADYSWAKKHSHFLIGLHGAFCF